MGCSHSWSRSPAPGVDDDQRPGAAALTRLDVDGTVRIVLEGITVSNGLAWSPDGFLVYYNDTATHRVDVFDYDRDGGLTGQRTFAAIPDGGRPDGLTVDEQGGVWVVLSNRGVVWHFTAEGMHDEVVGVPASKVTA